MPIDCDVVLDPGISFGPISQLAHLIALAATIEPTAPAGEWELTVRLTDDSRIASLHERFFGDPSPTDVISFPSGDPLDGPSGYVGDVVVSVETAERHARDAGHSMEREVAFLALHGLLHLCGHDDRSATARAEMLARQEHLLSAYEDQLGRPW